MTLQHLSQLRTLKLDIETGSMYNGLSISLDGLSRTVQSVLIDSRPSSLSIVSWPSAGSEAHIQLRSYRQLTLQDDVRSSAQGGQLLGCQLELQARELVLHSGRLISAQQAGDGAVCILLSWIKDSQAASVIVDPEISAYRDGQHCSLRIRDDHHWCACDVDYTAASDQLLSVLQLHCDSHGLSCSPGDTAYSVCISRGV